ncbi:phage tail assembly chaperone [Bradyrhizobium monzae]|uniref:phage tail assembly chaperone n=1 Tax=Bradyrhizobium sp. Oc8 TaxID=2876780 RepID=UPI001F196DE5|nr:phage tail assembly chaperone [Bradyrhizobium sp. Oc8]
MNMQHATFALQVGSKVITLRPTLRAAFHLHQKYSFQGLYQAILDGDYTASMDLITATCADVPPASIRSILDARDQLLEFILILRGGDTSNDKPQSGEFISFEEHVTYLYKIGAGQLGWAPDVVWDATPAEILAAREGRMELLKDILAAVFGSKEQSADASNVSGIKDDLNAIGDLTNHVRPR